MDVLSLDFSHATPLWTPDEGERSTPPRRRIPDRLLRLLDLLPGSPGEPAGAQSAAATRRAILLGYTAAEITMGIGLLVIATVAVPIGTGIASSSLDGTALAGPTGGVLLWTMFGLMGSVRSVSSAGGSAHFSFHLPFVGAAMILGGPTAGAWVAFLSTIDRRELESQPWYGILANHAAFVTAAIAGAVAYAVVSGGLLAATGDNGLATFAAILVAGVVLETVANGLALATIKLRDDMSWAVVLGIVVDDFRRETLLEIALIWILVIASSTVGWWAPLLVGIAVVWYLALEHPEGPDALTGLMRKVAFVRQAERKVGLVRRGILPGGTMLFTDLNGFHLINNKHGYEIGDAALRVVAERMRLVFPRHEDLLSRLMGDEFGVFLVGMTSVEVAIRKAQEFIDAVCQPVPTPAGLMHVGAAVGIVVCQGSGVTPPSAETLMIRAAEAMHRAKHESGPCGGWHVWSPDDPTPRAAERREPMR